MNVPLRAHRILSDLLPPVRRWIWVAVLLPLAASHQSIAAGPVVGIGYVAGYPKQKLGGMLAYSWTYADIKVSTNFYRIWQDTYENITVREAVHEFGDSLINSDRTYKTVDGGLIARFSRGTSAYLGLGITETRQLYQFQDDYLILGKNGRYWVENRVDYGVNFQAGLFLRVAGPLHAQLGVNTNPRGFDLGLAFLLSSR